MEPMDVSEKNSESGNESKAMSSTSDVMDDLSDTSGRQEYETQFLGFTPKSKSDGMYNAIVDYIHDVLRSSAEFLFAECSSKENVTEQRCMQAVEEIYCAIEPEIGKIMDKMEVYIYHVLRIPPNALLPEDEIHAEHPASGSDVEKLEADIASLKNGILAARYTSACLQNELDESEPLLSDLDRLIKDQKNLDLSLNNAAIVRDDVDAVVELTKQMAHERSV